MDEAEFDKFAAEYRNLHAANIRLSGEAPEYFVEYKIRDIAAEMARANRAQAARTLHPEADFAVGIEGGVEVLGHDLLAMAWVVIIDRAGKTGKARSGSFVLPKKIAALIRDEGLELGDADDIVFGQSDSKRKNGSVGLLTGDVITRADFYTPAVTLALIPFHNPALEF